MSSILPKISIIIPVFNSAKTIRQCLDALSSLDYPSYEIIVVDDGSTDATAKICLLYPQILLIRIPNGGPSKARNLGVQKATGEIVAFTDGDCIVDRKWLLELRKGFSEEHIAGVGGNQVSPPDETTFGKYVQDTFFALGFATSYMKTPKKMSSTYHNPSCNSAYRKKVFLDIGGFDESLWPGEDVDLDNRITQLNFRLIRTPKAIVKHYRPQSLSDLSKMMQRYGGSAFRLFKRYGFFRPLQYLPFITLTLVICMIAGLIYDPRNAMYILGALPALFLFFVIKEGISKRAVILCLFSLLIFLHWHIGFLKALLKN
jgi:O-antigen biosynthesis protein